MTQPITPLRRALSMTAIFAGPGFLILFLIIAFLGALQPMPGAKEALQSMAPNSTIVSVNAGGRGNREPSQRRFVLIPKSLQEQVLYIVKKDELSQLTVSKSSPGAFYTLASIISAAGFLTLFVSIPTLWRLYQPRQAVVADDQLDELTAPDDHA